MLCNPLGTLLFFGMMDINSIQCAQNQLSLLYTLEVQGKCNCQEFVAGAHPVSLPHSVFKYKFILIFCKKVQ